jgi:hypothetical protein
MKKILAILLSVMITGCSTMPVQTRINAYDQMLLDAQNEMWPAVHRRVKEQYGNCLNPDGSSRCIGEPIYQGAVEIFKDEQAKLFARYPQFPDHSIADGYTAVYLAIAKRADAGEITHLQAVKAIAAMMAEAAKYRASQREMLEKQLVTAQARDSQVVLNIAKALAVVAFAAIVVAAASQPRYVAPIQCQIHNAHTPSPFAQCQ